MLQETHNVTEAPPATWHASIFARLAKGHAVPNTNSTSAWVMLFDCRALIEATGSEIAAVVNVLATHVGGVAVLYHGEAPPEGRLVLEWLSPDLQPCEMTTDETERLENNVWKLELVPVGSDGEIG